MRKNLAVLLAGVLIGGLIFVAYPSPAAPNAKRLKRLENKVERLQRKTRFIDKDGFYTTFVFGTQVLSLCDEGVTATWYDFHEESQTTVLDSCSDTSMTARQLRQRIGQR